MMEYRVFQMNRSVPQLFPAWAIGGVTLLALIAFVARADVLNDWQWRAPLPQGNTLVSVVAAQEQFVAVGDRGAVLTSGNGSEWTQRNSGTFSQLRGVTHGGGVFVAVGFGPTILTSPDGAAWTPRSPAVTTNLLAVTHGEGMFVAVGFAGAVAVSPDGVNWSARSANTTRYLSGVAFGNGVFVAVGYSASSATFGTGTLLTSPDAVTWTERPFGSTVPLYAVRFVNERFIAMGADRCFVSDDGVEWSTGLPVGTLSDVLFDGSQFVGVGAANAAGISAAVRTSSDGLTWSAVASPAGPILQGIAQLGKRRVAVGAAGFIMASDDGGPWTSVGTSSVEEGANDVAFANGVFVVAGGGGVIWTGGRTGPMTARRPSQLGFADMLGLDHGDDRFVAVGAQGVVGVSTNGVDWERIPYQPSKRFEDVCVAQGKIVAVAASVAGATFDGTNWHVHNVSDYYAVTHGRGLFVAGSLDNRIAWSADGIRWTVQSFAQFNGFSGVAYGNGVFVAATFQGRVFVSSDGTTWGGGAPLPPGIAAEHLAFGGGLFTISGGEYVLTSVSGAVWTPRRLPVPDSVFASGYGDGVILAVGEDGVMLQSGDMRPRLTGRLLPDGSGLEITLHDGMAAGYWIESASNPVGPWNELHRAQHDGVRTPYVDTVPGWREEVARFYRLRRP